jgi:YgiT-type zinc finger domain-containing protein
MHDICPVCQMGRMHEVVTTYVALYAGTLVHMPNVRAWRCDICRETYFDDQAIREIEALIGVDGLPPNQHVSDGDSSLSSDSPAPLDDTPGALHPPSK